MRTHKKTYKKANIDHIAAQVAIKKSNMTGYHKDKSKYTRKEKYKKEYGDD